MSLLSLSFFMNFKFFCSDKFEKNELKSYIFHCQQTSHSLGKGKPMIQNPLPSTMNSILLVCANKVIYFYI